MGEHPQIPGLLAYFQSNNSFFLAQQLIDGQNLLKEFEQEGKFSEAKTRTLLQTLLPVLQYIHARHIIHRDIKPENIMRQASTGNLVLIDFGISKIVPLSSQTRTGTIIGSQGYASPEQVKGRVKPCSDLFSLGATCFHLLSGVEPSLLWANEGYSWVDKWQSYLSYSVEPQLAYVLNRLLEKDWQQRYQSASEALQDLQGTTPLPTYSKSATAQKSLSKNLSARSSVVPTATKATSTPTYSSRDALPSANVNSLPELAHMVTVGILVIVGVIGGFAWLMRSQLPQPQTPVIPVSPTPANQVLPMPNTPQPPYPQPPYPRPPYPPPGYAPQQ